MHYSLARFPPCLYKYVQPPDDLSKQSEDSVECSEKSLQGSLDRNIAGKRTSRYKVLRSVASNMSLTSKSVCLEPIMRHRPSSMSLLMAAKQSKMVCETENLVTAESTNFDAAVKKVPKTRIYEKIWDKVGGAIGSTPMYFQSLVSNPRRNYPHLFPRKSDLVVSRDVPQRSVRAVSLKRSSSLHYTEVEGTSRSTPSDAALATAIGKALDELSPELEHLALVNLDSLQCPLCFDVFSTIQPLPCCGNWSCEFCLQHWVSLNGNCPFCRAQLSYSAIGEWSRDACLREDAKIDHLLFENLVSKRYDSPASSSVSSDTLASGSLTPGRRADDTRTLCEEEDDCIDKAAEPCKGYYFKDLDREKRLMQDFHLLVHQYVLDSLQVSCIYDSKGCTWQGERRHLRRHLEQNCCETRKLLANNKGYMTIDITELCGGVGPAVSAASGASGASGDVATGASDRHNDAESVDLLLDQTRPVSRHRDSFVSLFGGSFGPHSSNFDSHSEAALESQSSFDATVQHYIRRQRFIIIASFTLCIIFPIFVVLVNLHFR